MVPPAALDLVTGWDLVSFLAPVLVSAMCECCMQKVKKGSTEGIYHLLHMNFGLANYKSKSANSYDHPQELRVHHTDIRGSASGQSFLDADVAVLLQQQEHRV